MAKKEKYGHRDTYPRFYKADNELQQRVGTGTLDPANVSRAQEYMNSYAVDIVPQLRMYLESLNSMLDEARTVNYQREEFLPPVLKTLMNVKSDSGMFQEMMVCRISAFVLTFMEDIQKFDNDIVEILDAYLKVSKTLLDLKIRDETNPHGQSFLSEIRAACKRYYEKRAVNTGR